MEMYTTETLQKFVAEQLASGEHIVLCRGVNSSKNECKKFICLNENINYRMYWRGEPQALSAGDYLHADPKDIYGISAKQFAQCFTIINE